MNSKSPLSSVQIRVTVPKYWLGPMRAQSLKLGGCLRKNIGSESHFARACIERGLIKMGVNLDKIREYEINELNKGISLLK